MPEPTTAVAGIRQPGLPVPFPGLCDPDNAGEISPLLNAEDQLGGDQARMLGMIRQHAGPDGSSAGCRG